MRFFNTLFLALFAVPLTATPITGDLRNSSSNEISKLNSFVSRAATSLSKDTLLQAMEEMSDTMATRGGKFTLIVQGGAVNVLLGDRETTGDMDFITTTFNPANTGSYLEDLDLLSKGSKYAYMQSISRKNEIPSSWTDTSLWSSFIKKTKIFIRFKSETTSQNTVLSNAGIDEEDGTGITFLAAPWDWQIVSKIRAVGSITSPRKPYDLSDAVFYLQQWLKRHNMVSTPYTTMEVWFSFWSPEEDPPCKLNEICAEINKIAKSTLITNIP